MSELELFFDFCNSYFSSVYAHVLEIFYVYICYHNIIVGEKSYTFKIQETKFIINKDPNCKSEKST